MRMTKIRLKTIILRHWRNPGQNTLPDGEVCQRISAETGWELPQKKHRAVFMQRYLVEVVNIAVLQPVPPPVVTMRQLRRDFYRSDAWRALRYEALKLHGGKCQCCGRGPSDGVALHVDHIKPRSKYPELQLVLSNLQVLCEDCNLGKGARDETDWRPALNE